MSERLVLWDIDGTLLNSGGVGRDLYGTVFVQLFGRPLEEFAPMAGRTDRSIILETLTMAGVPEPRRHVDPFIAEMSAQVPLVRSEVTTRGRALPGAAAALAALAALRASSPDGPAEADGAVGAPASARSAPVPATLMVAASGGTPLAGALTTGATLAGTMTAGPTVSGATTAGPVTASSAPMGVANSTGAATAMTAATVAAMTAAVSNDTHHGWVHQSVLTGNIRTVAEVKLAVLGLRESLDLCIGAYGDDHEVRAELVQVARRRAAAVHGRTPADFDGTSTVLVGDTPLDIEAALATGARAVGVASGAFSCTDLTDAGAHAVLPDLTDTAAVLRALLAED